MKKRHTVRGAMAGLMLGVSIGMFLTIYRVVLFGSLVPLFIAIAGLGAGVVLAQVAPNARRRKQPPVAAAPTAPSSDS